MAVLLAIRLAGENLSRVSELNGRMLRTEHALASATALARARTEFSEAFTALEHKFKAKDAEIAKLRAALGIAP